MVGDSSSPRAVGIWLLVCCALVAIMVCVGGLTRLTHSGLSMVEWKPLTGFLPPLNQADWESLFAAYRTSPEFLEINRNMTLESFKGIFWLEFIHRVIGRLVGLAFALPFLWFLIRGQLARCLVWRLVGFFILGGLQGVMGWYMVMSGLVDRPDVSHYRLAAHLGLAFLIFALMFRQALALLDPFARHAEVTAGPLRLPTRLLLGLVSVTVIAGAFVAGLDAGLSYNTFPLMGGQLIPDNLGHLDPWYLNPLENTVMVQFDHRVLALTTTSLALWLGWQGRNEIAFPVLALVAVVQLSLGILTLLLEVPVALGSLHQMGALALFTATLWALHRIRPIPISTFLDKGVPCPVR
ncbi:COX15/CtaA family protein [Magnetospira sp. QH-2]|uniref:COX15/CtaA family protein n=1 Tax=Magnetospira sp. (strain QH-2) TaxID=1288970 RepID=UPI0003E81094|nr:COX15/CtaA family protein [Magnetospira sp. QH-2]CCQ74691.1 Heme A synthase [Magnetospira sp. QH-2]